MDLEIWLLADCSQPNLCWGRSGHDETGGKLVSKAEHEVTDDDEDVDLEDVPCESSPLVQLVEAAMAEYDVSNYLLSHTRRVSEPGCVMYPSKGEIRI